MSPDEPIGPLQEEDCEAFEILPGIFLSTFPFATGAVTVLAVLDNSTGVTRICYTVTNATAFEIVTELQIGICPQPCPFPIGAPTLENQPGCESDAIPAGSVSAGNECGLNFRFSPAIQPGTCSSFCLVYDQIYGTRTDAFLNLRTPAFFECRTLSVNCVAQTRGIPLN